jgi:hypothetical protein
VKRLSSTVAQRMPWPDCRHDGARGFASGHRRRHQTGHGIPCAVVRCAARLIPYIFHFFGGGFRLFSSVFSALPPLVFSLRRSGG